MLKLAEGFPPPDQCSAQPPIQKTADQIKKERILAYFLQLCQTCKQRNCLSRHANQVETGLK